MKKLAYTISFLPPLFVIESQSLNTTTSRELRSFLFNSDHSSVYKSINTNDLFYSCSINLSDRISYHKFGSDSFVYLGLVEMVLLNVGTIELFVEFNL